MKEITSLAYLQEFDLIIMVGLPRAGKSTFCHNHLLKSHIRVSSDDIRLSLYDGPFIQRAEPMVWSIAEIMARSLIIGGHKIVIDATNLTHTKRKIWVSLAQEMKKTHAFAEVPTPVNICLGRANDRLKQVIKECAPYLQPVPQNEYRYTHQPEVEDKNERTLRAVT